MSDYIVPIIIIVSIAVVAHLLRKLSQEREKD